MCVQNAKCSAGWRGLICAAFEVANYVALGSESESGRALDMGWLGLACNEPVLINLYNVLTERRRLISGREHTKAYVPDHQSHIHSLSSYFQRDCIERNIFGLDRFYRICLTIKRIEYILI